MEPKALYSLRTVSGTVLVAALLLAAARPVVSQDRADARRVEELERLVREQEERLSELEKRSEGEKKKSKKQDDADPATSGGDEAPKKSKKVDRAKKADKADEAEWAEGLLTVGGVKFRFGGKIELNFINSEEGSFPPLGAAGVTDEADPYIELQRLRLEPELEFNRWISARGQIDFKPSDGETILKELIARHDVQPAWWFRSRFQVGLDDRFIRPARRTKTYPLIGNAFWRDESVALTWQLTFGAAEGSASAEEDFLESSGSTNVATAATDAFDSDEVPGDDSSTSGADPAEESPFDFVANWGEIGLVLSLGQGYELNDNEVGFDGAAFNDLVQDDRELESNLALRELGIGLGYRRRFGSWGRAGIQGFYFNDELRGSSIAFLQSSAMTTRSLITGQPVAGYGNSSDDASHRYGFTLQYFLPASTLFADTFDTRKRDGLRLLAQWIGAQDGEMDREGWFVQASYRFSFQRLLFDRYIRSLEPIVRYGELEVDVPLGRAPNLPGTWDRDELLVGAILEVTSEIWMKFEYVFHGEDTGAGSVDNDELLIQLLFVF